MRHMTKKIQNDFSRLESRFSAPENENKRTSMRKTGFSLLMLLNRFLYRLFEIAASSVFIIVATLPVLICKTGTGILTGRRIFETCTIYGMGGIPLQLLMFSSKRYYIRNATLFCYVLTGKIGLVGIGIEEYGTRQHTPENAYLMRGKPGIFSLWFIRESGKIGHEGRTGTEWEYVFRRNFFGDIALILKSIPAALMRSGNNAYFPEIVLFGIKFKNTRMKDAVQMIDDSISSNSKKKIFFINPDCLNKTFSDNAYHGTLCRADSVLPDGSGLNLACKIIGKPLLENVNGTDLFPFICRLCAEKGRTIYLLGAKPGIADTVKRNMETSYPGIRVLGTKDGFFNRETESAPVINEINRLAPDILMVAFGAPHQERWIDAHSGELNAKVCIGVGGLFDFFSGRIPRAPKWMREFGLEWIYRLKQEPGRMWRRYIIGNPLFVFRVIKWKAFMEVSNAEEN